MASIHVRILEMFSLHEICAFRGIKLLRCLADAKNSGEAAIKQPLHLMDTLNCNSVAIPANTDRSSLATLNTMLGNRSQDTVHPCIRDLVENGLDLVRFAPGENVPNRQDVTQYLAAWSRHAGLTEVESANWLIDYCSTTLKAISRRMPAAIRHSTKSNLKYIYGAAVPFVCGCENNRFRARCGVECSVYADMHAKLQSNAIQNLNPKPMPPRPPPPPPVLPVKQVYLEQFKTGLSLALDESRKGTKLARIVELLNERGLKTRTGRKWKQEILSNELMKLNASQNALQISREGA